MSRLDSRRASSSSHNASPFEHRLCGWATWSGLQALEPRRLLTTFVVTITDDDGAGSLRDAIVQANNTLGPDDITFNIPGGGVHTIRPQSPLPSITGALVIDGYSQPGSSGNTLAVGNNAALRIEIDGSQAGLANGLHLLAPSCEIYGLVINSFAKAGIVIENAGSQRIAGNFIGTNVTGSSGKGNGEEGIFIINSGSNIIGGLDPADRNVISGNGLDGVNHFQPGATGNSIQGNYIGTNAGGTSAIPNLRDGVRFDGAPANFVGGLVASPGTQGGNVISGNARFGVFLVNGSDGSFIEGNIIGANAAGTAAIAQGDDGIQITRSVGVAVGGTQPAERNLISGNAGQGIELSDGGQHVVAGNFIGVDISGNAALPNGGPGIEIDDSVGNQIGADNPESRNIISGNLGHGIVFTEDASENSIRGNAIGVGADGQTALGNGGDGVRLAETSFDNTIGGADDGAGNVIAHNVGAGVAVIDSSFQNRISRNAIFDNGGLGIDLANDGPTANDLADTDTGPNTLQNFPTVGLVVVANNQTTVSGSLAAQPETTYRVELFVGEAPDASGFNEGRHFLGAFDLTTNDVGEAGFSQTFPFPANGDDQTVTATATDPAGNTSEFFVAVEPPAAPDLVGTLDTAPLTLSQGGQAVVNVNVANAGFAAATGGFTVQVFASEDGVLQVADTLLGTATITDPLTTSANLNVGVDLTVPDDLAVSTYTLIALVDASNAIAEVNENNNSDVGGELTVTAGSGPAGVQFGSQSPGGKTFVVVRSANNTLITFKLSGPGVGTVIGGDGAEAFELRLAGTDATSKLTITTKSGDGRAVLSGVTGEGQASLKSFTGKATDLAGDFFLPGTIATLKIDDVITPGGAPDRLITIGGVGADATSKAKLRFDDVSDLDITSGVVIGDLTVDQWIEDPANNDPDVITAVGLNVLNARGDRRNLDRGDFEASLNLTDATQQFKKVSIKGLLTDAVARIAGPVGGVTVGAVTSTTFFVGVDGAAAPSQLPTAGQIGAGSLASFTVKGKPEDFVELAGSLVRDLNLAAADIASVKLKLVDTATPGSGDGTFGIAALKVGKYQRDATKLANILTQAGDHDAEGSFVLRILDEP